MPRVKGGVTGHRRHKKILEQTAGFRGSRHKLIKRAKESLVKALAHECAPRVSRPPFFARKQSFVPIFAPKQAI